MEALGHSCSSWRKEEALGLLYRSDWCFGWCLPEIDVARALGHGYLPTHADKGVL
jgi:hypothetical protein